MRKHLFNEDMFSNSIPTFKKSNDGIAELLQSLLTQNYNNISADILSVEQFQGNEINSNNYKVTTTLGTYLMKKFIDINEYEKLQKISLLSNWLNTHQVKTVQVHLSNKNEFIIKSELDGCYWSVFDFINGSFFTGKSDQELASVGSSVGNLFTKLNKLPTELCPSARVEHFTDQELLLEEMKRNRQKWISYFGKDLSCLLADNWEFLEQTYSQVIDNKKILSSRKIAPCHIDLHPHNILVEENQLKAILDIDSIKLDYSLVPISFSMYKLLRQSIMTREIKNSSQEISRVSNIYFNALIDKFSISKKEIENLYIYAATEIFRRIFIIFLLNLYHNDSRWNHVLSMHINGLKEAEIIFDSLKT